MHFSSTIYIDDRALNCSSEIDDHARKEPYEIRDALLGNYSFGSSPIILIANAKVLCSVHCQRRFAPRYIHTNYSTLLFSSCESFFVTISECMLYLLTVDVFLAHINCFSFFFFFDFLKLLFWVCNRFVFCF